MRDAPSSHKPTYEVVPHYSTDMNAAWQIVERYKEAVVSFHVARPKKDYCELWDKTSTRYCAYAETPQEAICLAALKSVGIEV